MSRVKSKYNSIIPFCVCAGLIVGAMIGLITGSGIFKGAVVHSIAGIIVGATIGIIIDRKRIS